MMDFCSAACFGQALVGLAGAIEVECVIQGIGEWLKMLKEESLDPEDLKLLRKARPV